jgi:hypothetical protein
MNALPLGRWCSDSRCRDFVWGLLAFALWLNANPYIGIDHDARLYSLAAYRWLSHEPYGLDPWFLFGSQDDFSVFSPLLAGLFTWFGVSSGAMIGTLLQGGLFATACLILVKAGLARRAYPLALLVMTSFSLIYSPNNMLYVTEGFVTARGFAVPLSLLGLAWSVKHRFVGAVAWHLAALLLHPIMAVAPAAVSLLMFISPRGRLWLITAGWGCFIGLLFAALHGYLPLIDGEWRWYVQAAPLVFIDSWLPAAAPLLSFWAVILLSAARFGSPVLRAFYAIVLAVIGSGVSFSVLSAVIPSAIALQAQLWRGLWLFKLVALLALVDLLWHLVLKPEAQRWQWMSVGFALTLLTALLEPIVGAMVLVVAIYFGRYEQIEVWLTRNKIAFRLIMASILLLALPGIAFELTDRAREQAVQGLALELAQGFWRTAGFGGVAVSVWWACQTTKSRLMLAGIGLLASGVLWDIRSTAKREIESHYDVAGRQSVFKPWISRGASVYWHQNTERVWFELGTASYAGSIHATGLVFSKARTELLVDRYSRIVLASEPVVLTSAATSERISADAISILARRSAVQQRILSTYEDAGEPTAAGISWLCADPKLNFVIAKSGNRNELATVNDLDGKVWSIYRCDRSALERLS